MVQLPSILLIDDNQATNFLHARVLRKSGRVGHVHVCTGGEDAISYLTSPGVSADYPKPDLIFLDINMPGMSGWEFLEAYRQLPEQQRGGIVIVMLTTSLNPDDQRRAESIEEINGFQQKPLTVAELNRILDEYFMVA
ncbi:response regulator [Lewinella sp. 4G2]|uniref:response regulator n=1 Tax=Lewinella sp. 4G2 TaxID=1803372 RepID=UPI0007B4C70A|nr:response regulator [Lewinella sp. 4G2]OAV44604.1 hypothetical protein A3850_008915 [Lewinella sp. 4G2]